MKSAFKLRRLRACSDTVHMMIGRVPMGQVYRYDGKWWWVFDGRCDECYWTNMEAERQAEELESEQRAERASDEYWDDLWREREGLA